MTTTAPALVKPPVDHGIIPRDMHFNFSDASPRAWYGGDSFKTNFFNALFTLFPPGEDFFVRSVLYYRGQIKDEKLQRDITNFSCQEGIHSRCHADHLDILEKQGYTSLKRENNYIDAGLRYLNKRMPKFSLALTVALEHFTAMLSHQLFIYPELFLDPAHEDFRPLMAWHALEELEHKAVAFDVYQQVDGSHARLVLAIMLATISLTGFTVVRMVPLLFKDKVLFKWKTWKEGLPFLYGKHGIFTISWRQYLRFYDPDFHPWHIQDYKLGEKVRDMYSQGILLTHARDLS